MDLAWIIVCISLAYGAGITLWTVFSLFWLIPEGSKKGLRKAMQDPDYLDDVIGPSQERLVKFMRKEFPMLGSFNSDEFITKIECRIRDQVSGTMTETMQSLISQITEAGTASTVVADTGQEMDTDAMIKALIMKKILGEMM